MTPQDQSLMDKKLAELKSTGTEATVFLKNGVKLVGRLMDFDSTTIVLDSKDYQNGLPVQRDAVSSVGQRKDTPTKSAVPQKAHQHSGSSSGNGTHVHTQ